MIRKFEETPYNFSAFKEYVITDSKVATIKVLKAPKCYVYDACSFRKHMLMQNPKPLLDYIKRTNGIIIISRSILMELCSSDYCLWQEGITYLEQLHRQGICVLLLFEENVFDILTSCFSSIAKVNGFLTYAVRAAKSEIGTVNTTLEKETHLREYLLYDNECADRQLYQKFFTKVRQNKEPEDHLGEELLLICLHVLCHIPEADDYKYILLTEDKAAISRLVQVERNIERHVRPRCLTALTTAKLVQLLWDEGLITSSQVMRDFLDAGHHGDQIRVYCSEKFDMSAANKSMTIDDLVKKIVTGSGIHIYY